MNKGTENPLKYIKINPITNPLLITKKQKKIINFITYLPQTDGCNLRISIPMTLLFY